MNKKLEALDAKFREYASEERFPTGAHYVEFSLWDEEVTKWARRYVAKPNAANKRMLNYVVRRSFEALDEAHANDPHIHHLADQLDERSVEERAREILDDVPAYVAHLDGQEKAKAALLEKFVTALRTGEGKIIEYRDGKGYERDIREAFNYDRVETNVALEETINDDQP